MRAKLRQILTTLDAGGVLHFRHLDCHILLITKDGTSIGVDGRSYRAFCDAHQHVYKRIETGSLEENDLIIEWELRS